jgi:hypothetical protein
MVAIVVPGRKAFAPAPGAILTTLAKDRGPMPAATSS